MQTSDMQDFARMRKMAADRAGSQGSVSTHNHVRSQTEVSCFLSEPLQYGAPYFAYLTNTMELQATAQCAHVGLSLREVKGLITTWMGDPLAFVTKITSYRAYAFGQHPHTRGTFWAVGIDGRKYYGTHCGRGMYCRMRLAKHQ